MNELLTEYSHRRFNPLSGEWILVSPHRTKRPWQGQNESIELVKRAEYDAQCYLCPGNTRAGGQVNPNYTSTFTFKNDFAALQERVEEFSIQDGLLNARSEKGICKVICFSPRHDLTLPQMSLKEIVSVIQVWKKEYNELGAHSFINHVQIFENKGSVMGCSNPHPHGQVWAQESVPAEVVKKSHHQEIYYQQNNKTLLSGYLAQELSREERILYENEHMVALVPYWAVWPYEAMILPKRPSPNIVNLNKAEENAFADVLRWLTIRYDNLFQTSFPYSAGIHQCPTDGKDHAHWHWHMSFYPPLLRSATVKKFMVGYELFANPQRDVTAEQSAARLRELPSTHYAGS